MKNWKLLLGLLLCSHSVWAQQSVTIYAASSMTNAVTDIITAFEKQHDVKVTMVFGGSSSLARQIENGAPADVFLSANDKWVTYLIDKRIVTSDNVQLLAGNQLALVTPSQSQQLPFDMTNDEQWQDILDGERLAIGNVDSVPVGMYAKEALVNLTVWNSVKDKLAQTSNVRTALALVERGEVPLGIVYKTDALMTNRVNVLSLIDTQLYRTIHYPLVNLTNKDASNELVDFMGSQQAKTVLESYGFRTDMGSEKFAQ